MRELLLIVSICMFISCSNQKHNDHASQDSESPIEQSDTEISSPQFSEGSLEDKPKIEQVENADPTLEDDENDCIFDQATQTDEFLQNISELEGYSWDPESKTATIVLANQDTLLISRGGCYHFGVSAEFILRNDTSDYTNWKNVYNRVLWIAEILDNEFAYEKLRNDILSDEVVVAEGDPSDIVYFSNEYLQMNNYEIARRVDEHANHIILSYYIN